MGRAIGLILFGILTVFAMTVGVTACSPQAGLVLGQAGQGGMSLENTAVADYIVIGGKLSNAGTGEWLNNYAVIPYQDGIEITTPQTRIATQTGEHAYSGEGVHDGFFLIKIPNRYKLTAANTFRNANGEPVEMRYIENGVMAASELFIWLPDVHPGQIYCLDVPDKQLEFAIAAMPVDNAHLPDEIRQNRTVLLENGRIQPTTISNDTGNPPVTFSEEGLQLSNSEIESPMWTREFIAPATLNMRQVYDQYVAPATPEISYEHFESRIKTYNANLGADNMFQEGQKYYLPLPGSHT